MPVSLVPPVNSTRSARHDSNSIVRGVVSANITARSRLSVSCLFSSGYSSSFAVATGRLRFCVVQVSCLIVSLIASQNRLPS